MKLLDYTSEEIEYLIDLAAELKAKKKAGIPHRIHEGKNIALIFEKTSTRTRCAFEVAALLFRFIRWKRIWAAASTAFYPSAFPILN